MCECNAHCACVRSFAETMNYTYCRFAYLSDKWIMFFVFCTVCVHMRAWQMQWFMTDHLDYIIESKVPARWLAYFAFVGNPIQSNPTTFLRIACSSLFIVSFFSNCKMLFFTQECCKKVTANERSKLQREWDGEENKAINSTITNLESNKNLCFNCIDQ